MLPVLKLANTGIINNQVAVQKMSDHFNLTSEERTQMIPSGLEKKANFGFIDVLKKALHAAKGDHH